MTLDEILGGASSLVTNAATTAASYGLPVLAGGITNAVLDATPAVAPSAGTATTVPIGVYSTSQTNNAAANGVKQPVAASQTPAWLLPAALGVFGLGVVWFITRKG